MSFIERFHCSPVTRCKYTEWKQSESAQNKLVITKSNYYDPLAQFVGWSFNGLLLRVGSRRQLVQWNTVILTRKQAEPQPLEAHLARPPVVEESSCRHQRAQIAVELIVGVTNALRGPLGGAHIGPYLCYICVFVCVCACVCVRVSGGGSR